MRVEQASEDLTQRFSVLGAYSSAIGRDVIDIATNWLIETIELPSKSVVLAAAGRALDELFDRIDVPGPDDLIEPPLKLAILTVLGYAYDAIPQDPVV